MDPRQRLFLIALTLLVLATRSDGITRPIKIGAIFHKGDEDHMSAFLKAISETRYEHLAPVFEFIPSPKYIDDDTDSFKTGQITCELLEEGVAAIFGPASPHTRGIVASIAARYEIPHIEYVWREKETVQAETEENKISSMTINVYPDSEMVSQAIADVVDSMKWHRSVAIYENNEGLSRIQKALSVKQQKDNSIRNSITIRQLDDGKQYRPMLKEIRNSSIFNVIIDAKDPDKINDVLEQAKEIKLLGNYSNFVITYLDASKLRIPEIQNGTSANITGFNIKQNDVEDITLIDSAILYEAVFLLNKAMETLNSRNTDNDEPIRIDPVPLSCEQNQKYQAGPNITSIMRELSKMGKITGVMNIDEYGRRRNFNITILDFRPDMIPIGYWDSNGLHPIQTEKDRESYLYKSIQDKTFIISTRVGAPYVMEVTDGQQRGYLIDHKYYEGYCIDLIAAIADQLGFKYQYELVPGPYNGLIKRLVDRKSDLAICDLTITRERMNIVDFSLPFMNLGISILFSKPEEKRPELFSFLSPLSTDVWIYMATAYLGVSIMLFLQARMAPGEWDNPHPCNADPEELENNFDLKNSLWLTIGSLMQQGCDILPKAPSIRMLASMWWFFTLIMISSYTANLAAFLTAEKMDAPIKSVEDLAGQTKIKYGAVSGGATVAFFRDSNSTLYKRMYATMNEVRPSVFVKDNKEGVERVINSKRTYAFLMESTSIEYETERKCKIEQIGTLLDNKGYGIALPRNSEYRIPINGVILKLGEKGELQKLKKRWWQENGGGQCKKDEEVKSATSELGIANVGGVFLVLGVGCVASLIVAIFEFLWNIRKVAVREKITPKEALIAELKFAVNIWATKKPVKIAKSSGASSLEGGLGRAASTARSIVGSFLRLDMLDKFDKDHNTNNRSNDRKIN
ncbi:hypothetical protein ACFW04_007993 [Cataglyphis niger]